MDSGEQDRAVDSQAELECLFVEPLTNKWSESSSYTTPRPSKRRSSLPQMALRRSSTQEILFEEIRRSLERIGMNIGIDMWMWWESSGRGRWRFGYVIWELDLIIYRHITCLPGILNAFSSVICLLFSSSFATCAEKGALLFRAVKFDMELRYLKATLASWELRSRMRLLLY